MQVSHGPETLCSPEPGMLVIGMKSYGRNSAFLLKIGHQQVRDGAACVLCMLALHTAAGHSLCSSPSTSSAEFFGPMKHYAPSAHLLLRCCFVFFVLGWLPGRRCYGRDNEADQRAFQRCLNTGDREQSHFEQSTDGVLDVTTPARPRSSAPFPLGIGVPE